MKVKILIVDDNVEFRELLEKFLSRNFEVNIAENGLDALMKLQNGYMPDLILSDYLMPLVDGKTLVLQLRASYQFRHIPVIIISGIEKNGTRTDLIKSGANDYLLKPFSLTELGQRIETLLKVIA